MLANPGQSEPPTQDETELLIPDEIESVIPNKNKP